MTIVQQKDLCLMRIEKHVKDALAELKIYKQLSQSPKTTDQPNKLSSEL